MTAKNNNKQQIAEEKENHDNGDEINKIVDFLPKFKIMQSEFDKAIIRDLYSENGKRLKGKEQKWPRLKETDELIYEKFMSRVCDPVKKLFYPQKDSEGRVIKPKDGGPNCRYYVQSIFRLRTVTADEEYLFSSGIIRGYDVAGSEVHEYISKPEAYMHTNFDIERIYDSETKTFYENCKGPSETYEEYQLPFSPENVQTLYDQRDKSRNAKPVNFYVKDEHTDTNITVRWGSVDESLKLLKEKSFVYLYNGNYMPEGYKQSLKEQYQGFTNAGNAVDPSSSSSSSTTIPHRLQETTPADNSSNREDINAYS